jgi:hypothetical protein
MAERLTLLGRADPLGHFFLAEDHSDNHPDRCSCGLDELPWGQHDADACLRSAKSIVISSRTHVLVKL